MNIYIYIYIYIYILIIFIFCQLQTHDKKKNSCLNIILIKKAGIILEILFNEGYSKQKTLKSSL